ncbi:MAG: B12-binding domain-containing radical SAM protein [Promethearchaeota archaeon]
MINPPFNYIRSTQTIPLGLLNLGTILKNHGFEIKIFDLPAENPYGYNFLSKPPRPHKFLQQFKKFDPDIIGITSVTENYPIAMKIAQMCKKENENIKIIFGGPHVTFQAEECLNDDSLIDIIAIGETEHVIIDIIKGLAGKLELNKIDNIIFKKNGYIKKNRVSVPDLDNVPPPDFEIIKNKHYLSFAQQIEFSRGCPYQCAFCCLFPISKNRVRYFPAKRVVDTLVAYQQLFKNFSFTFADPTFLLNPKKVRLFLDELKNRKMILNEWNFKTRIDTINRSILRELKKYNVYAIFLGIEDIHNSVLQTINKKQTFSQIKNALKIINNLNFTSHSNFVIGLPSQTRKHMLENISYANNVDHFVFLCLTPMPGSRIFTTPENFGLKILSKNWSLYNFREILTDSISFPAEQQKEMRDLAWNHMAEAYLQKESTAFFDRKEYEHLLEIGFESWYDEWKNRHLSGWN